MSAYLAHALVLYIKIGYISQTGARSLGVLYRSLCIEVCGFNALSAESITLFCIGTHPKNPVLSLNVFIYDHKRATRILINDDSKQ